MKSEPTTAYHVIDHTDGCTAVFYRLDRAEDLAAQWARNPGARIEIRRVSAGRRSLPWTATTGGYDW